MPTRKTVARICGAHFFVCTALRFHFSEPYFGFDERQPTMLAGRIQRVLRTPFCVAVPLVPAPLSQHPESGNECVATELTIKPVLGVGIARSSMRITRGRVIEELTTEARVARILCTADLMPVARCCSRNTEIAGDPEGCDENLLAVPAGVPVARIHLARCSMLLTRLRAHQQLAAKAFICWIFVTPSGMGVATGSPIHRLVTK
mmetsp:Transcript_25549/g.58041  ORF Transcript_25549/g.58041 Transcript_25549/m.58041 type:complete len:204 (+) Transcript_25549:1386-1997(+)